MHKEQKEAIPQKGITFKRLVFQALPEMWVYQILSSLLLAVPAALLKLAISWLAGFSGEVLTTANMKSSILSWRFPVILLLGVLLVFVYMVLDLLAQVYLTDNLLNGRPSGSFRCIGRGFQAVRRFMNPAGFSVVLFILIATPLCGVGLGLSLSETFYIPNFIMDVVLDRPLFAVGYVALIFLLAWTEFRMAFVLHAVLLDNMTVSEGKKYSARIVKAHRWPFLRGILLRWLGTLLVIAAAYFLFFRIPSWFIGNLGADLPRDYRINDGMAFTDMDYKVAAYRVLAAFFVLIEKYLVSVAVLLCMSYLMLRLNRYYLEYTGRGRELWPKRPKNGRRIWKILLIIGIFIVLFLTACGVGFSYDDFISGKERVKIIAHRTGGRMASENSIEGLEKAVEQGLYGAETDVQRTKDGYYIINHDDDFARLTGVAKKPGEMTLEEIKKLRIRDTTGNGKELPVVTLEEMLDVIKGKIKLFVELKGVSADRQMVDDLVRIIREHDCVEDTALISLNYNVIKYAEQTYPEFETGTLFFASLGNVSKLECDLLIMEEETASGRNLELIHDAGKKGIVWTVNSYEGLHHFLDSKADAVITDEIMLAGTVQEELDGRTDLEILEDRL